MQINAADFVVVHKSIVVNGIVEQPVIRALYNIGIEDLHEFLFLDLQNSRGGNKHEVDRLCAGGHGESTSSRRSRAGFKVDVGVEAALRNGDDGHAVQAFQAAVSGAFIPQHTGNGRVEGTIEDV